MQDAISRATSALLTLAVATSIAAAQSIPAGNVDVIYVNTPGHPNNVVPGLGVPINPGSTTTNVVRPWVSSNDAHLVIEMNAATGSTTDNIVLIRDGALLLQEGTQAPWAPAGETCEAAFDDDLGVNDVGDVLFAMNTNGTAPTASDEYVARYDGLLGTWSVVAREGDLVDPVLPALAGATWGSLMATPRLSNVGALWESDLLGGLTTTTNNVIVLGGGAFLQNGVTVPLAQAGGGVAFWENFDLGDIYTSADGLSWLVQGDTDAATTEDVVVVVNDVVVMQEGHPVPGGPFAENVTTIGKSWMDHWGNYYIRGSNATTGQDWVVRNGVVVATADALEPIVPGSSEHWDDTTFSTCFFCFDGNSTGAFVFGGVTDAPTTANGVIVLDDGFGNRQVILRENDPVDLDGNGLFDDDRFWNTFGDDDVCLLESGNVLFTATLRNGAGTAVDQGLFLVRPGAATCAIRNGTGVNPLGFECTSAPVIGGTWNLTTSPGPNTVLTVAFVGLAPQPVPVPFNGGEVLIDPTGALTFTSPGTYSLAVPPVAAYQGVPLFLQAVKFENVGGGQIVLTNAIDAVLGN